MADEKPPGTLPARYSGPLDAGMNAAIANARRLVADAAVMLADARYPSAFMLTVLAIEESGKVSLLRTISTAGDPAALKGAWADFRKHTIKNGQWVLRQLVLSGARKLADFRPVVGGGPESDLLDYLKRSATYADCEGDQRWSEPSKVITAELAADLLRAAEPLIPGELVSVREIELWIEHVGPVVADTAASARSVVCWAEAMKAEGIKDFDLEALEAFIGGFGEESRDQK
jgi:AbiV family abortive infection protein